MRKACFLIISFFVLLLTTISCKKSNKIVIWTSGEDYRNEAYLKSLNEKFPQYKIELEYMSSSNIASKIIEEKDKSSCDIILSEEYGYLGMCEPYLEVLDKFDFSQFIDDIVPQSHKFTPEVRNAGSIIINKDLLKKKNIPIPSSFEDLTKPVYKNLISMPNPRTSGTGYMFLLMLVNSWGEDKAFNYFSRLSENILQFTTSGSGPINALIQNEVAIGLGMTAQAFYEINKGAKLDILYFNEGSPFSTYGNAVLKKSAGKEGVMDVFNYLSTDLCKMNNELFFPEPLFKNFVPNVEGYPRNVKF